MMNRDKNRIFFMNNIGLEEKIYIYKHQLHVHQTRFSVYLREMCTVKMT